MCCAAVGHDIYNAETLCAHVFCTCIVKLSSNVNEDWQVKNFFCLLSEKLVIIVIGWIFWIDMSEWKRWTSFLPSFLKLDIKTISFREIFFSSNGTVTGYFWLAAVFIALGIFMTGWLKEYLQSLCKGSYYSPKDGVRFKFARILPSLLAEINCSVYAFNISEIDCSFIFNADNKLSSCSAIVGKCFIIF